ncbi:malate dehydrogenase [Thioalkalivibrio sp. HK1]|uniref:malate dehydrogenase n=1 Tax=Thioalkalivibrio sp. HK1 TaxID=1469245 RepID=UPI0004704A2D|nr:malate dehydrogenase [Thioalkalivibrio sp. HK1]
MGGRRVIGVESVEDARRRGRRTIEILRGDIVTALAKESAERLGIRLVQGPIERAPAPEAEGHLVLQRALWRRSARWTGIGSDRQGDPLAGESTKGFVGGMKGVRRFAKLALVGAGGVGANIAQIAAMRGMAEEIALIDISPGLAAALALDLEHAGGMGGNAASFVGGESLDLLDGADVVVMSAGRSRRPGMERSELAAVNARVIRQAANAIRTLAPRAVVIVITNPLDEMTLEMLRATGFERERVLGMSGTLDSARLRQALAQAARVDAGDIDAIALGSHGREMIPIISLARIRGRSLDAFLSPAEIESCIHKAINGGGEIVALKKTGSATIAPAHATIEILDHLRGARHGAVPVSVMLAGEYGIEGVAVGVPAHLGSKGLVDIVELPLDDRERERLKAAAAAIRRRCEGIG